MVEEMISSDYALVYVIGGWGNDFWIFLNGDFIHIYRSLFIYLFILSLVV